MGTRLGAALDAVLVAQRVATADAVPEARNLVTALVAANQLGRARRLAGCRHARNRSAQVGFAAFVTHDVQSVALACISGDVQPAGDVFRADENPRSLGSARLFKTWLWHWLRLVGDLLAQAVELRGRALQGSYALGLGLGRVRVA